MNRELAGGNVLSTFYFMNGYEQYYIKVRVFVTINVICEGFFIIDINYIWKDR